MPSVLERIVLKQKIAIRCISKAKYNAHTGPLFKKAGILPFHSLAKYFKLKFMHAYKYGLLPRSFHDIWQTNNERNLRYNLRNTEEYNVPRFRTNLVSRLPMCSFPKIWNNFADPKNIKSEPRQHLFSNRLKRLLLDKITTTCNRVICPVCHMNL